MNNYPIKRTIEEGHTPKCWTAAITTAMENQRDAGASEYEFRLWLQDNGPLRMAEDLLADGSTICYCDPISLGEGS